MRRTLVAALLGLLPLGGLAWPLAQIGGGIFGKPKLSTLAIIDFNDVNNECEDSVGITLVGAAQGDLCKVARVGDLSTGNFVEGIFYCFVSSTNTVMIRHCDPGATALDPASSTWAIEVTKR